MRQCRQLILLIMLGCGHANAMEQQEVLIDDIKCTITRVAERHIAVRFPEFDSIKYPPIVLEQEGMWRVRYKLPDNSLGGTPVLFIEKGTFRIIRSYHEQ